MISLLHYFGAKPHTQEHIDNATDLLTRVCALLARLNHTGPICPNTGTWISGSKGGSGDGGFRLSTATTGKASSSHKEAKGIDIYDPQHELSNKITDALLEEFGLYREAPIATPTWCHLTTRAPRSNRRTFLP